MASSETAGLGCYNNKNTAQNNAYWFMIIILAIIVMGTVINIWLKKKINNAINVYKRAIITILQGRNKCHLGTWVTSEIRKITKKNIDSNKNEGILERSYWPA